MLDALTQIKVTILRDMITRNGDMPTGDIAALAQRFTLHWRDGQFVLVANDGDK